MQILRDYQEDSVTRVLKEWETVQATLGVAATGMGKTTIFSEIIRRIAPKRALVLCHRGELVAQAAQRLGQFGIDCEIEKADQVASTSLWNRTPAVVATPQTLFSGRNGNTRMKRFNPADFGAVIVDECFPSGTLVDGRPIESIKLGDMVNSFNHLTNKIERRRVTRLFKSQPRSMVLVTLKNGTEIICTFGHPFFTQRGYVGAGLLLPSDMVFCNTTYEKQKGSGSALPRLRKPGSVRRKKGILPMAHSGLLLDCLHVDLQERGLSEEYDPHESRWSGGGIIHQNEITESNEEAGSRCQNGALTSRENIFIAWWKRKKHSAANFIGVCREWYHGVADSYLRSLTPIPIATALLQGGHCVSCFETGNRSGRKDSQTQTVEIPRRSKDSGIKRSGVASVEILERGNRHGLSQVCPDGFVYNIEVEGNHNYFVEGVLVHNCHLYVSDKYLEVVNYFKAHPEMRVFGYTATPDRHDQVALAKIFQSVAFDIEITDGIDWGYLVPVKQQLVKIDGLDFSNIRTTSGDLNGADLARVMEQESNLQGVASAAMDIAPDKRMLVFAASVAQAEKLSEIFNRHKTDCADWVHGGTPEDLRKEKLRKFADGRTQIMVNCAVLTTGYDNPGIEVIVSAKPTKSRALYSQCIGRGTRPLPGTVEGLDSNDARRNAIAASTKPHLLVIDYVGNAGRHALISTADVLGGRISEEAKKLAIKRITEKGEAANISEEMRQAESDILRQIEEQKKREAKTREHLVGKAQYRVTYIDPFAEFERKAEKWQGWKQTRPFTEKQRKILEKAGADPDKTSLDEGADIIKRFFMPSDGQRRVLTRAGYSSEEVDKLKKWEAGELITALVKNGWKRPTPKPEPVEVSHEQGPDDWPEPRTREPGEDDE